MMFAKSYRIFRNVTSDIMGRIESPQEPVMVASLLDEVLFNEMGNAVIAGATVEIEQRHHAWSWDKGSLLPYSGAHPVADVLVIYELVEFAANVSCLKCSSPLITGCEHQSVPTRDVIESLPAAVIYDAG